MVLMTRHVEESAVQDFEESAGQYVEEPVVQDFEELAGQYVEESAGQYVEESVVQDFEESAGQYVQEPAVQDFEETAVQDLEDSDFEDSAQPHRLPMSPDLVQAASTAQLPRLPLGLGSSERGVPLVALER